VAEGGAGLARYRLGRGEAGDDLYRHVGEALVVRGSLEHGRGHREDARVAGRDYGDSPTAPRQVEGELGAFGLDSVVAGVALLAGARWGVVWLVLLAMFIFARRYRGFRARGAAPR